MIIILTTLADYEKLKEIGRNLLEERLIACYNLMPIESGYWWKGKIEEEKAFLMILKTKSERFAQVQKFIAENTPEETPEIISVEAGEVDQKYLAWLNSEVK